MSKPRIFLALPNRSDWSERALGSIIDALRSPHYEVAPKPGSDPLLPVNFCGLWCDALNMRPTLGLTHFAMLHSDVGAGPGWLAALLAEMETTGADVVAAHCAIKDGRGLSCTALHDPVSDRRRRLTMRELHTLPPTIDAAAAGEAGSQLLVGLGCVLIDFRRPWVEHIHFRESSAIGRDADGKFYPAGDSEDWLFSMDAAALGARIVATLKVTTSHRGPMEFGTAEPWGAWATDQEAEIPAA